MLTGIDLIFTSSSFSPEQEKNNSYEAIKARF